MRLHCADEHDSSYGLDIFYARTSSLQSMFKSNCSSNKLHRVLKGSVEEDSPMQSMAEGKETPGEINTFEVPLIHD